jgi:hypothetical protein
LEQTLSFSAYRELGFEKVLLVEGITDVLTIQQFLRLYQKDHQVVLLPMGGNSFISGGREQELGEITRITPHVSALIDSEKSSANEPLEQRRLEFVQSCHNAGIQVRVLDRRATENYLTDAAVKKVEGSKYQALSPYQKLNTANPCWSKAENWRIARMMNKTDLDSTDLGQFLAAL